MATITDTTTDANGNIIINVSSSAEDAITLATAGTYSDKNIIFNIKTPQSTVQPDWNQNDSTAPDYVKNRPFYTGDPVETVLVEESTVPFRDEGGAYSAEFESTFMATVGETYKIFWDGTAYECVCVNIGGSIYIGNLSILGSGSDTGEPFVMIVFSGALIYIITTDASASHTFSISGEQEKIVKIPEKFIDKDTSGYIVDHKSNKMTEQEMQNYMSAISAREVAFVRWGNLYIHSFQIDDVYMYITTINGEKYQIRKDDEGVFSLANVGFYTATFPYVLQGIGEYFRFSITPEYVTLERNSTDAGVGTANTLFLVKPTGAKSKPFEVLENGEIKTQALILYSSTAGSTKKFRITVDDSGKPTFTNSSDSADFYTPTDLPPVTSSDSGKFLRVSSAGEWVAETIPNASGVSF